MLWRDINLERKSIPTAGAISKSRPLANDNNTQEKVCLERWKHRCVKESISYLVDYCTTRSTIRNIMAMITPLHIIIHNTGSN